MPQEQQIVINLNAFEREKIPSPSEVYNFCYNQSEVFIITLYPHTPKPHLCYSYGSSCVSL